MTKEQELQIARQRIAEGNGSPLDVSNVGFADKSAGDLSGTLSPEEKFSLPDQSKTMSEFSSLRNLMDKVTRQSYDNKPSVESLLKSFNEKIKGGEGIVSPSISGDVVSMEKGRRVENVEDIYRNTLRTISTMEAIKLKQQENVNSLMGQLASAGLMGALTGQEFDAIMQTGVLPITALQKINQAKLSQINKPKEVEPPTIDEQLKAAEAGYDIEGDKIVKKGAKILKSTASGNAYDMSTYAKDPVAHTQAVSDKINEIGKLNNITDLANYIYNYNPESPIVADMVVNASEQFGVGWEELTALMRHESSLGASPVAESNNNPGGITWSETYQESHPEVSKGSARPKTEGGNYVKFKTMQDGVNAVAEQLAYRKTEMPKEEGTKFTPEFYKTDYGQKVLQNEQDYNFKFMSLPVIKEFLEIQNKAETVRQIVASNPSGAEDLALVFEFMKSLDPTSVVRESEYDTASKVGNPFKRVAAKIGGYVSEGQILPEEVKQEFNKLSQMKMDIKLQQYEQVRNQFRKIAEEQDLNPEHVAPDLTITFDNKSDWEKIPE